MPTSIPALFARFEGHLAQLPADARRDLARQATLRARALGLVVVRAPGDVDIPLTLSPELVEPATTRERARDAKAILGGVVKAARHVLSQGVDSPRARLLFNHFGPLEQRCLADWEKAEDVTIARVDWFLDAGGRHHALELNATIPAMEAYSDAAARAWIETFARHAGLSAERIEQLVQQNGSNAEELRRSIVTHSGWQGTGQPSIAILHRANDSQQRELQALQRHFASRGHTVRLATPEDVTIGADGHALVSGERWDILYRHIFARRMPEGSALEQIALGNTRSRLQNPINGHLEVKGLLAELSRLVWEEDGRGLALTEEERHAARHVAPWTRVFGRGAAVDPDGAKVADLAEHVAANPQRFVLKRSWDYGGKSVHIGRDVLAQEGLDGWKKRVSEALADGDGAYVVQQLVDSPLRRHLVVGNDGENGWEDVFVDASTYAASGEKDVPGGGVARFARTGIVNIVGGGGVSPLIHTDVAEQIAGALR